MTFNEKQGNRWFKVIVTIMILAVAGIFYMVGRTSSTEKQTAQIVTAETPEGQLVRVLQYEGVNYIVGIVDSTGTQQIWQTEILGFLISQANDRGIRRAMKAIGYEGPQKIEITERTPDAP